MITRSNFPDLLKTLGFNQTGNIYYKTINGYELKADFANEKLIYPEGLKAQRDTTKNFSAPENFVVFECVHNLLKSGYKPEHIILEQGMPGGHGDTGGFCDIIVQDNDSVEYLLIECKTADDGKNREFSRAWVKMQKNGGQLFNYFNTYRRAKWLCLYCADFQNNKAESIYHLISMTDNNDFLKNNNKLQSFTQVKAENGTKGDYFNVWTNTYQQDFITHNLFESEIFKVGNRPYNVNDLKIVDNDTIQKKYHQFATIMRQHNVSARENAFDKLVNLFLCKVVDEKANPENLKVYWKGAASDNHYDLQDRLQQLYKVGMKDFLGEDVTYISEEEINNAFHLFKNKKDETKRTVLEYFTQLKFYSNNPFAFLDVHNEKLFFQNAVILKEIVQMLQDIKLKNEEEQHQFLGDLFEGFLDQGVKQSEGQFFTPMPIVKFLISSLPLEKILQSENAPKVIDYACGAGHFLTEYASQIKPILTASSRNPSEFYKKIYGIEKEYRLSKVAKVSAFMYGQDEMNIIYADALAQNKEQGKALQDGSFSLLVANPPYSVKGFLKTLSDEDKAQFSLYENIGDEETFNSIETFFIEKAKQLLHADGIAVIVLPTTILTNGNIYIKCREILLQNFDLVAIAEFGSGTFGKTGTNTATLFLRRKQTTPNLAEHYKNRVEQWQSGNFSFDGLYEDHHLLQSYCNHCNFNIDDYKAFLSATHEMPLAIAETELFQEYRKVFEKKKFPKSANLAKAWLHFAKEIEADKLHFFMLAQNNQQEVLVVRMPTDNKEKKAFLGYEWSSAKGNEGIKYLNQSNNSDEDDSLAKLKGIEQIQTPLFNPKNLLDEMKINSLIRQSFNQQAIDIPESLSNYVSLLPLSQMLDFSRVYFEKTIRTSVQKKIEIVSKYPSVKLSTISNIYRGVTYNKNELSSTETTKIILPADNITLEGQLNIVKPIYLNESKELDDEKRLKSNDIFMCFSSGSEKHVGKLCFIEKDTNYYAGGFMGILRAFGNIIPKYLFNILNEENMRNAVRQLSNGSNIKNLSNIIGDVKISIPPLDIQQKIIDECQKIDDELNRASLQIKEYRTQIEKIFNDLELLQTKENIKLNKLCKTNPSKSEIKSLSDDLIVSFVEMSSVSNNGFIEIKVDRALGALRKGSYTYFRENDIIIAKITPCMENGKCALATGLSNGIGMGSSEFHVFRADESKVLPSFLFYSLNRESIRKAAEKNMTGSSGHRRVPISFYEHLEISLPDLNKQQDIINQINEIEIKISELEKILASSEKQKKAVLEKWL